MAQPIGDSSSKYCSNLKYNIQGINNTNTIGPADESAVILNSVNDNQKSCSNDKSNRKLLFKVVFRDELTSSIYGGRLQNIIKNVFGSQNQTQKNSTLEVYESFSENGEQSQILDNKCQLENKLLPMLKLSHGVGNEVILNNENIDTSDFKLNLGNSNIRIPYYKYFKQNNVVLSKFGLSFCIPQMKNIPVIDTQSKYLSIDLNKIVKVCVRFINRQALVFIISPEIIEKIRKFIEMYEENGTHIIPNSSDFRNKCIIILPERISNESKQFIKKLFRNRKIIQIRRAGSIIRTKIKTKENQTENPDELKRSLQYQYDVAKKSSISPCANNRISPFFCGVVKIGSYLYKGRRPISLSMNGLEFSVPHLERDSDFVTLVIEIEDIRKISVGFCFNSSILFIDISAAVAKRIRQEIGMNSKRPHLDPNSRDNTRKRIIVIPEYLSENTIIIEELLKFGKLERLSEKMTNKTISKYCPTFVMDKQIELSSVNIFCDYIKLVNYVCIDSHVVERNVWIKISIIDLEFDVTLMGDEISIKITIDIDEIQKVSFCMGKTNVFFIHTTENCTKRIRSLIGIPYRESRKQNSVNFIPTSSNTCHQLLIFKFDQPKAPIISFLRNLLNSIESEEISHQCAKYRIENEFI